MSPIIIEELAYDDFPITIISPSNEARQTKLPNGIELPFLDLLRFLPSKLEDLPI